MGTEEEEARRVEGLQTDWAAQQVDSLHLMSFSAGCVQDPVMVEAPLQWEEMLQLLGGFALRAAEEDCSVHPVTCWLTGPAARLLMVGWVGSLGLVADLLAAGWVGVWGPERLVIEERRLLQRAVPAVKTKMEGEVRTEVGLRAGGCLEGSAQAGLGAPGGAEKAVRGMQVAALRRVAVEMTKQLLS